MRCAASAPAMRGSCSCTSCRTRCRRSSCARPSAWGSRSWWRRCSAFSAWARRRPTPDWGLTIAESRQLPAGRLVVFDLPGACDPGHGARLQPARRRLARSGRSAPQALAMTPAWARSSKCAASSCRSAPTRASRAILDHIDFALATRPHPRRRRQIGLRQVDHGAGHPRHPAGRRAGRERRYRFCRREPAGARRSATSTAASRQPHRLRAAGPLSGAEPGIQDRRTTP